MDPGDARDELCTNRNPYKDFLQDADMLDANSMLNTKILMLHHIPARWEEPQDLPYLVLWKTAIHPFSTLRKMLETTRKIAPA